jgi:transposase
MRQKSNTAPVSSENLVRDIRRATRKHHAAEEKIRIVLDGLRGETSIAELCRREGIAESMYYSWSKEFLEAGKRRLAGDTARAATTDEVNQLRREAQDLKEVVAEQALALSRMALGNCSLPTMSYNSTWPGGPKKRWRRRAQIAAVCHACKVSVKNNMPHASEHAMNSSIPIWTRVAAVIERDPNTPLNIERHPGLHP